MVRFATSLMMILAVLAAAAGNGISQARLLRSDPNSPLMVRTSANNTRLPQPQPQPQPHEGSQTVSVTGELNDARQDKPESSLKLDEKKADKEEEEDVEYTWTEVIVILLVIPLICLIGILYIVGGGVGLLPEDARTRNFFKILGRKCSLYRFER